MIIGEKAECSEGHKMVPGNTEILELEEEVSKIRPSFCLIYHSERVLGWFTPFPVLESRHRLHSPIEKCEDSHLIGLYSYMQFYA